MDPLKSKFYEKASLQAKETKAMLKEYGNLKVDEVTISQGYGGMRGIKSMVYETSLLDPIEGIRFRGFSIPQLVEKLPKAKNGKQPLPEGLFWLMLTSEVPTESEVAWLSAEWNKRSDVPSHIFTVLDALPLDTHPMTQFVVAVSALQTESTFAVKYDEGMSKQDYWDYTYEDSMDLIAKLPRIAAYIYRRSFKDENHIAPDLSMDWSANFSHMLGNDDADFVEMMRLYLTIHSDHEGGNASAHATHLVGSTLSDPYRSFAAGMQALAGPLHGLANQEVIKFVFDMLDELGTQKPTKEQIIDFVNATLASGKVIPGYGHAVLREPDPRFVAQRKFAEDYIKDSDIVEVVWKMFDVVPEILMGLGKVKNPWPNVDAHSGALLVHYGFKEFSYYTVLFGVSRALGVLSGLCWSRALGLPLERPKSVSTVWMKEFIASQVKTQA